MTNGPLLNSLAMILSESYARSSYSVTVMSLSSSSEFCKAHIWFNSVVALYQFMFMTLDLLTAPFSWAQVA